MRALRAYRSLLSNTPLTRLLIGEFVSGIGDWLYIVALFVVIYRETDDATTLGVFAAVRMLPYIGLSIPAGFVADRFDRRMVLLVTDLLRGALMLAMAAVIAFDGPVVVLMGLAVLAAGGSTFFYPAIGGYIPRLVRDERELGPANSAWAALDNVGFVVGPALGGLLLAFGGAVAAFVVNAATFVVIAAVLWTLPASRTVPGAAPVATPDGPARAAAPGPEPESGPALGAAPDEVRAPVAAGRSLRGAARPLGGLVLLQFAGSALHGAVTVLTVILAIDVLKAGEAATGPLNAAIGIGGVSGAVIAGVLVLRRNLANPILLGGLALAVGFGVLGFVPGVLAAMVAIAVHEAGHLVLDVANATILQRVVPDAALGRGVGIVMTAGSIGEAAGSAAVPVLIAAAGLGPGIGAAGVATAVTVGVSMLLLGGATTRAESAFEATLTRVAGLPLFTGVPPARLERALGRLVERKVAAGETIVRQGEPADAFYIVRSGEVVVSRSEGADAEREVRRLGPDTVFGELGLLRGGVRTATVSAVTETSLLVLGAADFLHLVGVGGGGLRTRLLSLYETDEAASAALR